MTKITSLSFFICMLSIIGFTSCSDNNNDFEKEVVPGVYQVTLTLNTDGDSDLENKTRGIDTLNGVFSNTYPYNEIYLHSGDNDTENHKMIQIPIDKVESCKDCKGIILTLEIKEEGGYIIRNRVGDSMELTDNETVYFSSLDKTFWNAVISNKNLPFNKNNEIYLEDKTINKELLRSYVNKGDNIYNYTKETLFYLFNNPFGKFITMSRHCDGFRLFIMFSRINTEGGKEYSLEEDSFKTFLSERNISSLHTNIYLGPYFCPKYDMFNMKPITTSDHESGGYYSSDNQNYRKFEEVHYAHMGGEGLIDVQGYGFQTVEGKFLLAPIIPTNNDLIENSINITCFINATYTDGSTALKSFTSRVPDIKFEPQMTHMNYIIMAFDYHELEVFDKKNNKSRTYSEIPENIKLKPLITICK